ncbi:MAG: ABC transporter substrate-binding protein [Pseudomonadota bacterium]
MQRLAQLLTATAIAAVATATVPAAVADVEIEVYHAWPSHKRFHEPIAAEFMEANPGITVTFRTPGPTYDDAHQAVLRGALTGELPDVFHSGYHLLRQLSTTLAARSQIIALDDLMAAEGQEWIEANYAPNVLNLGTVDGVFYGMPFNASTPIVYYNMDLVTAAGGSADALPEDWDSLIALGAKIAASADDVDGMAYDVHAWPDDWLWQALMYQEGGSLMNADETEVAFGNDIGLRGLELARRIVTEGGMPMLDFKESRQQFCAGKLGIIFSSTAGVRRFTECSGDNFALKTHTFPVVDKENGGVPTGGNAAVILSNDAEKKAAAWKYLKFIAGPRGQEIAVLGSGYMPTNKRAVEAEFLGDHYDNNPNWVTSLNQADRAQKWVGYPGNNGVKIWRTQREIIDAVMRGQIEPQEGLDRMVAETQALLPRN